MPQQVGFLDEWARNVLAAHEPQPSRAPRPARRTNFEVIRITLEKYVKPRCRMCNRDVDEAVPMLREMSDAIAIRVRCHGQYAELEIPGMRLAIAMAEGPGALLGLLTTPVFGET